MLLLVFGTLPIVRISKYLKTRSFRNWVSFRPQVSGGKPTLSCPLERANKIQCLLVLSKGPSRVGAFLPLPEEGNRLSLRNAVSI
jgi:hypothetical protein